MTEVVIYITVFVLSFLLTAFFKRYSVKHNLIDIPNNRSSHTIPTPRGGGLSIVIIFQLSLLIVLYQFGDNNEVMYSILTGGTLVSIIGFLDDHHHVPAKWRFSIHLVASVLALSLLSNIPSIPIFGFNIELSLFGIVFYSFVLVWLLNLYNFMDGIDGIAGIEAITVLIGAAIILASQGGSSDIVLLLILSACVAGFLIWNWPPAKIFMGDSCSGFLGFTIGLMAISTSSNELLNINLWSWLILLSVFVVDSTYTLIRRITKGDKWYEAHRSHAYQIFARKYNSHKNVTIAVFIINTIWLFPIALLASKFEFWAPLMTVIALFPLVYMAHIVGAGRRND